MEEEHWFAKCFLSEDKEISISFSTRWTTGMEESRAKDLLVFQFTSNFIQE